MSKVYTKYVYKYVYKNMAFVLAHKIGLLDSKIINHVVLH